MLMCWCYDVLLLTIPVLHALVNNTVLCILFPFVVGFDKRRNCGINGTLFRNGRFQYGTSETRLRWCGRVVLLDKGHVLILRSEQRSPTTESVYFSPTNRCCHVSRPNNLKLGLWKVAMSRFFSHIPINCTLFQFSCRWPNPNNHGHFHSRF